MHTCTHTHTHTTFPENVMFFNLWESTIENIFAMQDIKMIQIYMANGITICKSKAEGWNRINFHQ